MRFRNSRPAPRQERERDPSAIFELTYNPFLLLAFSNEISPAHPAGFRLATPNCRRASKPANAEWLLPALSNAPSVVEYSHRISGKWGWMIDHEDRDFVVVDIGEDFPDHFTPG